MAEEHSDVAKNLENLSINGKTTSLDLENGNPDKLEDGLPLVEVYKLALNFYKGNLYFFPCTLLPIPTLIFAFYLFSCIILLITIKQTSNK